MGRLIIKGNRNKITCDWCGNKFSQFIGKSQDGERDQVVCTKCFRTLPSSIIKRENGKHFHKEYPKEVWEE